METSVNPLVTYVLVWVLSYPTFKRQQSGVDTSLLNSIVEGDTRGQENPEEDKTEDLPMDGGQKKSGIEHKLLEFTDYIIIDFALSIAILTLLIVFRENLTPAFLHQMSSMTENEVYYICMMSYWLFWKCFLNCDKSIIPA